MVTAPRSALKILLVIFVLMSNFLLVSHPVFAQAATAAPTPPTGPQYTNTDNWIQDPIVTEVGKNAERSRQLLSWVFSHAPSYRVPAIAQMWAVSRNIAYVFVIITIIGLAVSLVLSRRNIGPTFSGVSLGYDLNINLISIFLRVAGVVAFITFSYLLVLGLIQFADILMRFFIENVGGCDLFNIRFAAQGSGCLRPGDPAYQQMIMEMEKNYTDFVGFRNTNVNNLEMVNTSIFVIKTTTLTYNVMSTILILRQVILWFLLIASPFLALLLPFILIRNTGWIWIGTFLQWLFYGPLVALFTTALSKIWKSGVPFNFDFSRINTAIGQVYPTSINILYGGPAQALSPTNTSNYVDTYAEYMIGLVMLWAAMLLPWFLLRIFRDYCCDVLKQNRAALMQIADKIRGGFPPSPTPAPTQSTGTDLYKELPFRKQVVQEEYLTKERVIERINEKNVENVRTEDISRAFNLNVQSLKDIAHIETNRESRREVETVLNNLRNPVAVTTPAERRQFETIKQEFTERAVKGDQVAQNVVQAANPVTTQIIRAATPLPTKDLREALLKKGPVVLPQAGRLPGKTKATVSLQDYEDVKSMWLNHYRQSETPLSEKIRSREDWLEADVKGLTNALNLLTSASKENREKGHEQVADILPFLLLGGFSEIETITYLKAKLEAAKQIQTELEQVETARRQGQEDNQEKVEVTPKEEEKHEKTMTTAAEQALKPEETTEKTKTDI